MLCMMFCMRGRCPVVLLDQDEVATAVRSYLVAHGVAVSGPNTVRIQTPDDDTYECAVIVDPSGRLLDVQGNEVR